MPNKQKVVVMGGGTGTFAVVSALKLLDCDITSVIAVSDSGGSTGRIRDEFGFQPVGDLRQSLAAMADTEGQEWIRKILLYRFAKGDGLKGHNLGNLILTALQDMTGSTSQSLEIAQKIFNLSGTVIPVTEENVNLEITYTDGSTVIGEHTLDEEVTQPKTIASVKLVPNCELNPKARAALLEADLIVIGPGDFYASLLATLVVPGITDTFKKTSAKIVYVTNLMTRLTQTHDMTAQDHLAKIEATLQRKVDFVVVNNAQIPAEAEKYYALAHEHPVVDDLGTDSKVVRKPLISEEIIIKQSSDTAYRSLLRHDPEKLARVLKSLL